MPFGILIKGKVLSIPIYLHLGRISPESRKKLIRGKENQVKKGRGGGRDTDLPPHTYPVAFSNFLYACYFSKKEYHLWRHHSRFTCVCFALRNYMLNSLKTELFPRAPRTEQVLHIFLLVYRLMVSWKNSSQEKTFLENQNTCPFTQDPQVAFPTPASCLTPVWTIFNVVVRTRLGIFPRLVTSSTHASP